VDLSGYDKRVRSGDSFICEMLKGGEPGAEHEVIYDDGSPVAFLNSYPALHGFGKQSRLLDAADVDEGRGSGLRKFQRFALDLLNLSLLGKIFPQDRDTDGDWPARGHA
jgi:hypothetical protein